MSIFKNPQHCMDLLARVDAEREGAMKMVRLVKQAPGPERTLAQKLEKFLQKS